MNKIHLNTNQKEVLFIVAMFLVPFLDPGFALLLGLILSLTIGHPFLAINSRVTHILLQISVVGLGFGMNVGQAIEAGKTGILFTIVSIVVTSDWDSSLHANCVSHGIRGFSFPGVQPSAAEVLLQLWHQ